MDWIKQRSSENHGFFCAFTIQSIGFPADDPIISGRSENLVQKTRCRKRTKIIIDNLVNSKAGKYTKQYIIYSEMTNIAYSRYSRYHYIVK